MTWILWAEMMDRPYPGTPDSAGEKKPAQKGISRPATLKGSARAALRTVADHQVTPTQCISAAGERVSGPASA